MVQPRVQVLKPVAAPMGLTPSLVARLAPTLALWGFAGAGALMTFASAIPLFQVRRLGSFTEECVLFARELIISSRTIPYEQTDVLKKIPVVADYYGPL
ncbi:hypothetical protein C6P46_005252 [Rhodotorula mucilaginosa]|uniref:Uncharacterized protein n=1 Tax=Rhodotorula mucilaginosa TaxID=5537 RepID=A0A9P6VZ17_RHOMI|nr:hypothetical protein C6P46_005252 [Rhodotorula mucilaginosa]